MEYKVLPFDKIISRWEPDRRWCHVEFGITLGELIHLFSHNNDFSIFEEYKEIIRKVYQKENKSQAENQGIYKISKLFYLLNDFYRDRKFFNPMVATPEGDKYFVHPGRDRFQVLRALGYTEYEFLLCTEDEMKHDNIKNLKPYHAEGTTFQFNKRNFSTITTVDKTAFENWL